MKIMNIGRLLAVITTHLFLFSVSQRLKALSAGLLLFASVSLCLAGDDFTKNKTSHFTSDKAKKKIPDDDDDSNTQDTSEIIAKNKTLSFAVGRAEGKLRDNDGSNTQSTRGFMFDIAFSGEPLGLALDYFSGGVRVIGVKLGIDVEETLRVTEISLGARYYLKNISTTIDFYLGGGLALLSVDYELIVPSRPEYLESVSGSDSASYVGLGVRKVFAGDFVLGLDHRSSDAEFELTSAETNLSQRNWGLTRTSLTLGYNW